MNGPMYMILNLAVGGQWSWPGLDTSQTPASMKIAWVRAYATANTRDISGSAAITGTSSLSTPPALSDLPTLSASDWTGGGLAANQGTSVAAATKVTTGVEHAYAAADILPHTHGTSHSVALSALHMV